MSFTRLILCHGCARHVRSDEAACPFCAAVLPVLPPAVEPLPLPRMSRAAMVAFAATLGAAGCSGPQATGAAAAPPPNQGPVPDSQGTEPAYGAPPPPVQSGPDAGVAQIPVAMPAYGVPVPPMPAEQPGHPSHPDAGAGRPHRR